MCRFSLLIYVNDQHSLKNGRPTCVGKIHPRNVFLSLFLLQLHSCQSCMQLQYVMELPLFSLVPFTPPPSFMLLINRWIEQGTCI